MPSVLLAPLDATRSDVLVDLSPSRRVGRVIRSVGQRHIGRPAGFIADEGERFSATTGSDVRRLSVSSIMEVL